MCSVGLSPLTTTPTSTPGTPDDAIAESGLGEGLSQYDIIMYIMFDRADVFKSIKVYAAFTYLQYIADVSLVVRGERSVPVL